MRWFRHRRDALRIPRIPADDAWITVPFRYAEAARVSIHTIGNQPGIPVELKYWIARWLAAYNQQLISYMRSQYGSGIFPLLDEITRSVTPAPSSEDGLPVDHQKSWERWEQQFKGEGNNDDTK